MSADLRLLVDSFRRAATAYPDFSGPFIEIPRFHDQTPKAVAYREFSRLCEALGRTFLEQHLALPDGKTIAIRVRKWAGPLQGNLFAAMADRIESLAATPSVDGSTQPKKYLFGWPQILDALDQKNDPENQRRIARLNHTCDGPIIVERSGSQPKCEKRILIAWWNELESRWRDLENQKRDRDATVLETYEHGRNGMVVPEINGHIQNRKNKPRPRKT